MKNPANSIINLAIDRSDEKLDIAYRELDQAIIQTVVSTKPELLHPWFESLLEEHPGTIRVAFENPSPTLVHALMEHPRLELYPLNPCSTDSFRKTFSPSRAKDDPTDALSILTLLEKHHDKMAALKPESDETRLLRMLNYDRRKIIDRRTELTNELTDLLKRYYPQALELFQDLHGQLCLRFLKRWGSLQEVKKARPSTLLSFFYQNKSRSRTCIEKRLHIIDEARPLSRDPVLIEACKLHMLELIDEIAVFERHVKSYDTRIREVCETQEYHEIFESFPGAGPVMSSRLTGAFGGVLTNFPKAEDMQKYSGIAPIIVRSGKRKGVYRRYLRPHFLHQTFMEYSHQSLRYCAWARRYVAGKKNEGADYWTAIRSLAFKWIRIMHVCWKNGQPYDDETYLKRLGETKKLSKKTM